MKMLCSLFVRLSGVFRI